MGTVQFFLMCMLCAGHGRRLQSEVHSAFNPPAAFQTTGGAPLQRLLMNSLVGKRAQSQMVYSGGSSWNSKPAWKTASAPNPTLTPATVTDESDVIGATSENKMKKKKNKPSPTGIFAPAVLATKRAMGDRELNQLRADIIKKHTKVISTFVDTSESKFGQIVLRKMFEAADKDDSGALDKEELREALYALGFTFVKDKDLDRIIKKADLDDNEVIDFEEFVKETPKVLRMNLVQLAKANGHDLGFLA